MICTVTSSLIGQSVIKRFCAPAWIKPLRKPMTPSPARACPEDNAKHVVEFGERHVIGDRDQADDHRAHLAQNRSQNQAFEGGCFNHLSRLLGSPDPRLFGALSTQALKFDMRSKTRQKRFERCEKK